MAEEQESAKPLKTRRGTIFAGFGRRGSLFPAPTMAAPTNGMAAPSKEIAWPEVPLPPQQQQPSAQPSVKKTAPPRRNSTLNRMMKPAAAPTAAARSSSFTCRWEHASTGSFISQDLKSVRCFKDPMDEKYAVCVATALPGSGIVDINLTVLKASTIGVLIGVAENRESFPTAMASWPRVWGFAAWNGKLLTIPDGRQRHGATFGPNLMRGDLRGSCSGKTILMRVDMDRRQLYFKINTPDWMCATDSAGDPIKLSANLRPFVRFSAVGDSVALGAHTHVQMASVPTADAPVVVSGGCIECEDSRRREKVLRAELDAVREELDKTKLLYQAEQDLRATAERQRDQAIRQAETIKRSVVHASPANRMQQAARARELKETLLWEAHAVNEEMRESLGAAAFASVANAVTYADRWGAEQRAQRAGLG